MGRKLHNGVKQRQATGQTNGETRGQRKERPILTNREGVPNKEGSSAASHFTVTRSHKLDIKVTAMAFDSRNRMLIMRTKDPASPIRVYNPDNWDVHTDLGSDIDNITWGEYHDVFHGYKT